MATREICLTDAQRTVKIEDFYRLMGLLDDGDRIGVLHNLFETAMTHPDEITSRAFFHHLKVHAEAK